MACNIIAEAQVQVLVEDTIELFTPAIKIDEIRAMIQKLKCNIIPDKVIFQGILHKQIFFVNEDNVVVHQGVDIPFSGFLDLPGALPNNACQLIPIIEFIDFNLLTPTSLREVVVINIVVRLLNMPPLDNIIFPTNLEMKRFRGFNNTFVARSKAYSALG